MDVSAKSGFELYSVTEPTPDNNPSTEGAPFTTSPEVGLTTLRSGKERQGALEDDFGVSACRLSTLDRLHPSPSLGNPYRRAVSEDVEFHLQTGETTPNLTDGTPTAVPPTPRGCYNGAHQRGAAKQYEVVQNVGDPITLPSSSSRFCVLPEVDIHHTDTRPESLCQSGQELTSDYPSQRPSDIVDWRLRDFHQLLLPLSSHFCRSRDVKVYLYRPLVPIRWGANNDDSNPT